MLPELAGKRVVDLGCGFGWFCRWAREAGAASGAGPRRLGQHAGAGARDDVRMRPSPTAQADLETLELPAASFDLAYSSLTLHYLENARRAVRHDPSRAGAGRPLRLLAPSIRSTTEPGPDYLDEGPRTTDWLAKGVVKQHRTLASYLNLLIAAGFTIAPRRGMGPDPRRDRRPSRVEDRPSPAVVPAGVGGAISSSDRDRRTECAAWRPDGNELTPPDAARPCRTRRRARPSRGRRARRDRDRSPAW